MKNVRPIERNPDRSSSAAWSPRFPATGCSLAGAAVTTLLCFWIGQTANAAASANASQKTQGKPNVFWNEFRKAVKARDKSAIVRMTRFPFVVRWGNADENDPSVTYDRKRFQDRLDHLLALRNVGDDRTMAEVVGDTLCIADGNASSDTFMVGIFQFHSVAGTWRWTATLTADPSFFPATDSSAVPKASPLRKVLLDVIAHAARLKRPLRVSHLRSTGELAYVEAQEPGKRGRVVRALLQRQPDDPDGQMVWEAKHYSFKSLDGDADWQRRIDGLIQAGVPASLFSARESDRGDHGP